MPTESVEILIEANDLASAKFKQASNNAEASIKRVREVGERAKKSTEFFGTLANSLGGTAFGSLAGQIAGLTEKTAQFSDVAKTGTAGTMAFRASLVAAGAAAGFQFGKVIGEQAFQLTEFAAKIKEAEKDVVTATAGMQRALQQDISFQQQGIELIKDPEQKKQAYTGLIRKLEADMEQLAGVIAQSQADIDAFDSSLEGMLDLPGANKAATDAIRARVAAEKQMLEGLRSQRDSLVTANSERARGLELLRKQIADQEKADQDAAREVEAQKAKAESIAAIRDGALAKIELELTLLEKGTAAMREQELIAQGLSQADAQKIAAQEASLEFMKTMRNEEEAAAETSRQNAERVKGIVEAENEKLKERRILLEQGTEAAEAFRLMQQGVDEKEARRIAQENERLRIAEMARPEAEQEAASLSAVESRTLTRGRGQESTLDQIAKFVFSALRELQKANRTQETIAENTESSGREEIVKLEMAL